MLYTTHRIAMIIISFKDEKSKNAKSKNTTTQVHAHEHVLFAATMGATARRPAEQKTITIGSSRRSWRIAVTSHTFNYVLLCCDLQGTVALLASISISLSYFHL